jgi:hypothetical protein
MSVKCRVLFMQWGMEREISNFSIHSVYSFCQQGLKWGFHKVLF